MKPLCVVCEAELERGFLCLPCSDGMPDGTLAALGWAARRARELEREACARLIETESTGDYQLDAVAVRARKGK